MVPLIFSKSYQTVFQQKLSENRLKLSENRYCFLKKYSLLWHTFLSPENDCMKPRLLILPAAIRSHVLPSLYIADVLADEYEIVYAVSNPILADLVIANGYQAVMNSGHRVGYHMEASFLASKNKSPLIGDC